MTRTQAFIQTIPVNFLKLGTHKYLICFHQVVQYEHGEEFELGLCVLARFVERFPANDCSTLFSVNLTA